MDELRKLIGLEHGLDEVCGRLREAVQGLAAPVIGALEVNCSDESELECMAAFQRHFVEHLLPDLKTAARAPFRTCNLGARYERGAVHVAEQHYALPASRDSFKVMVLKINGHVSVRDGPASASFGPMERYQTESNACGALHDMLAGADLPALDELRDALGGRRVAALLDAERVEQQYRYLFAAIVSTNMQAARAVADISAQAPHTPTLYMVVPCVTFNRPGPDTELVCGLHEVDRRGSEIETRYDGLGDDPSAYRVSTRNGLIRVTDD